MSTLTALDALQVQAKARLLSLATQTERYIIHIFGTQIGAVEIATGKAEFFGASAANDLMTEGKLLFILDPHLGGYYVTAGLGE